MVWGDQGLTDRTLDWVRQFCRKLGGDFGINFWIPKPKSGYSGLVAFEWFYLGRHYWVTLTREFFHTFSRKYPGETGDGVSQETALLVRAAQDPEALVLVFTGDAEIFYHNAADWLTYARNHHTIGDFAEKETGNLASIPVSRLKKWYPEEMGVSR